MAVCPLYWKLTEKVQSAMLVHEGTHLAGTSDNGYYFDNREESPHDIPNLTWDMNASTYDSWLRAGFCVPGFNCPQKVTYVNAYRKNNEVECSK